MFGMSLSFVFDYIPVVFLLDTPIDNYATLNSFIYWHAKTYEVKLLHVAT